MFSTILVVSSISLLVYVLFLYPAILGWMAHRHPRPVLKQQGRRTVSIIIAVHNGAEFLANKLRSILDSDYPRELLEILVVSDGSTDGTEAIARQFGPLGVELIELPRGGKCNALNAGMARARGEILVLTDVRQTLDRGSLKHLVECFADPSVAVVSGELRIRKSSSAGEEYVGLYWRYERWIRNQLARIDSIFGASGAFYGIRRELAVPIPSDILLDDMYLPLAAFFRGYRLIVEERARIYDYPTTLRTEFRRKVRTLAGNYQIMRAYPGLLAKQNRMCWHFLSYKLGRLLLPYALIALVIGSAGLARPWRWEMLAVQGAFYGLAIFDSLIPENWWIKHVSSPVRTFAGLMLAALCAISIFFIPPRTLWKETRPAHQSRSAHGGM